MNTTFIRFVLKKPHSDSGTEDGIFRLAYALQKDSVMIRYQSLNLELLPRSTQDQTTLAERLKERFRLSRKRESTTPNILDMR